MIILSYFVNLSEYRLTNADYFCFQSPSSCSSTDDDCFISDGTPVSKKHRSSSSIPQTPDLLPPTPDVQQCTPSNSKHITGFSLLSNVRQKAQAYEHHVSMNSSIHETSTPSRGNKTLTPLSGSSTPVLGRVGKIQAELNARTTPGRNASVKVKQQYKVCRRILCWTRSIYIYIF